MNRWTSLAPILGRILIGGFFIWNGLQEIINFSSTTDIFIRLSVPDPVVWAFIAVGLEVLGGIALVTGTKTRIIALLLAVYVAVSATLTASTLGAFEMQLFLQNMAIVGGLLCLSA